MGELHHLPFRERAKDKAYQFGKALGKLLVLWCALIGAIWFMGLMAGSVFGNLKAAFIWGMNHL